MVKRKFLMICCTGIAAASLAAVLSARQDNLPPLSSEYAPGTVPRGFGTLPILIPPGHTGKPFRAEYNSRRVEPGPNGMETHEYHGIIARDSEGRFLRETIYPQQEPADARVSGRMPGTNHVFAVSDPVAGENFSWDDGPTKMIMKSRTPPRPMAEQPLDWCERAKQDSRFGHTVRGQSTTVEDLGERNIQGIVTHGCRGTTVISAPGNMKVEVPFTITDETWTSPDLRMTLVHTHNDPHGENLIERLDNIVLGEPDATIFLLPVNYKVNDMTARFEADKARSEANEFFITPEMPRPLSLAGPWEVDDPILGAATKIGILVSIYVAHQVELNQGEITSETSVRYNSPLVFQFYQRTAGVEQGIGFMAGDATPYLSASWDGQRLQAKFKDVRPSKFEHPDFALDLSFNKKQEVWTGDYTREGVTKQIRLERPGVSSKANPNPLMGAWTFPATETRGRNTRRGCLQIMQGTDGAFMAWTLSSEFGMTGRGRLPTTGTVLDNAGARWGIGIEGDMVTLDEWKYTGADAGGIGIPAKFVGKISADGTLIEGKYVQDRAAAQGQPAEEPTAVMRKTSIESCTQVTVPQRARQSRQ